MLSKKTDVRNIIERGDTAVGIELGSTRIKAVLVGPDHQPLASGSHDWENSNIDGIWTYGLDEIWSGIQASYANMVRDAETRYGVVIEQIGTIGVSAMMHGYLAFDKAGELLTPFRTWRNNTTGPASEALTGLFGFPIPQRWTVAHLYQAILNGEEHVSRIAHLTTLAGYVHWKLTGEQLLGIGEASGVFPIDQDTMQYNRGMLDQFASLIASYGYDWTLEEILPGIRMAGEPAGNLTPDGARLLDGAGRLRAGISLCPPEGDAGTGMVATNSVSPRTGNVSAGTSVFAMIVLEKALSRAYPEIDLVTTPAGRLVAMVHSNNCTSDYDAWIGLFAEALQALGLEVPKGRLYDTLLEKALEGDPDGGGLLSYGYVSGEHITHFEEGRPLFVRGAGSRLTLANFMRTQLFASLGALRTGLEILFERESVRLDEILGHGGFFKTREVGQRVMAAATRVPVSVMETAGEGGAWGIALLASYRMRKAEGESLQDFLSHKVFAGQQSIRVEPDPRDMSGFDTFMQRYTRGLAIERAAVDHSD
ncbi:MAG: ATPase [Clostridiaceae bacterium]|nr:ATPase [Clostridiaceae bacterium]